MDKKGLEKLLGGYATNTLSEAERKALFEAALHDQSLFDALANEQALKELLDDPRSRRRVLEALERAEAAADRSWVAEVASWFRRPANLALSGSLAVALLAVVFVLRLSEHVSPPASEETVTADSRNVAEPSAERFEATPQAGPATEADRLSKKSAPPAPTPPRAEPQAKVEQRQLSPATGSTPAAPPATPPTALARDEFARAPKPASPEATLPAMREDKPESAQAPSAGVSTPAEPLQQMARLQASAAQTPEGGNARELFYAQAGAPEFREGRAAELQKSGMARSEEKQARDVPKEGQKEKTESSVRAFGEPAASLAPMKAVARPLGLRYSILKRRADGSYAEADPAIVFTAGDALRLTVEVNDTGYLYILKQDPAGQWISLFPIGGPGTQTEGPGAKVEARTRFLIPVAGELKLEGTPGPTPIFIIFAREPQPELRSTGPRRKSDADVGGKSAAQVGALANRARAETASRSLLVEKVEPTQPGAPNEQAVYVVNPSADPASRLVVEIPLTVR